MNELDIIRHLGSEISGSAGLLALVYIFRNAIKDFMNKGQPNNEDLEKLKEELEQQIQENNDYIQTVDGKGQKASDRISRLEGKFEATQ